MPRCYDTAFTIKQFKFGYVLDNSNKMSSGDARVLSQIEMEINNLVSRNKSLGQGFIDTAYYQLRINSHLSTVIKNILNQYEIGHYARCRWCGIRKYTLLTFDKIIPRIMSIPPRNNSTPIEHIVSNAITIRNSNATLVSSSKSNTSRHDYLNPENKAQARKLRGIYNEHYIENNNY